MPVATLSFISLLHPASSVPSVLSDSRSNPSTRSQASPFSTTPRPMRNGPRRKQWPRLPPRSLPLLYTIGFLLSVRTPARCPNMPHVLSISPVVLQLTTSLDWLQFENAIDGVLASCVQVPWGTPRMALPERAPFIRAEPFLGVVLSTLLKVDSHFKQVHRFNSALFVSGDSNCLAD